MKRSSTAYIASIYVIQTTRMHDRAAALFVRFCSHDTNFMTEPHPHGAYNKRTFICSIFLNMSRMQQLTWQLDI